MPTVDHDHNSVNQDTHTDTCDPALTVLVQSTKVLSALVAGCVADEGLTLDEWLVLDTIHSRDGQSMSQISEVSGCSGASLTRTVDRLVSNSQVYREVSRTDRRKVEVFVADRGRETHARARQQLAGLERIVGTMTDDAGIDRAALADLFSRLKGLSGRFSTTA